MKFSFLSLRRFRKYIGEFNSLISLIEISIQNLKQVAISTNDVTKFIKTETIKHSINLNLTEWPTRFNRFYQELLVSVYSAFESFYSDIREDIKLIKPSIDFESIEKNENNKIKRLMHYSGHYEETKLVIDENLLIIFEYYYLIRNYVVHIDEREETKLDKIKKQHSKVLDAYPIISEIINHHKPPNLIENLEYSDFIIFTKVTNLLCKRFNDVFIPTNEELKKIIEPALIRYEKFKKNKPRFIQASTGYLREVYGLRKCDAIMFASEYFENHWTI